MKIWFKIEVILAKRFKDDDLIGISNSSAASEQYIQGLGDIIGAGVNSVALNPYKRVRKALGIRKNEILMLSLEQEKPVLLKKILKRVKTYTRKEVEKLPKKARKRLAKLAKL
jgi:hypothetical protein